MPSRGSAWLAGRTRHDSRLAFLHDSRAVQLGEYARHYPPLFDRSVGNLSSTALAATLCRGLALVYGVPPRLLTTVTLGSGPAAGPVAIDLVQGRIWIALPRVGYTQDLSPLARLQAALDRIGPRGRWCRRFATWRGNLPEATSSRQAHSFTGL
jgi:hypothetical protein